VNAREVESAAADVESTGRRALRSLAVAAVAAAAAAALAPSSSGVAIGLGLGGAAELIRAIVLWLYRRERIERLALDPSAYAIREVARVGARFAAVSERRRLAGWIDSMVHDRGQPLELHLVGRAGKYAHQLEALARELAPPSATVEPATAVACRRLLTRPVESPLYNPNLPEEDLRALLIRLGAGITSPAGPLA
jgi:hypothetical protein